MMNTLSKTVLTLSFMTCAIAQAHAADRATLVRGDMAAAASVSELTAAEMEAAQPMLKMATTLPDTVFDLNAAVDQRPGGPVQTARGGRPSADAVIQQLLKPRKAGKAASADVDSLADMITPDAYGTGALQFTSSRMYNDRWWNMYPARATGKLFFQDSAGYTYSCSASAVKPGIVVTAGHCVHSGNGAGSGWYTKFKYVPSYHKGAGVPWTNWAMIRTSLDWYNGGGAVPNQRDYAIMVFNKDASGRRIGNYTGWYGYRTNDAIGRQLTVMGYPGNLDSGEQLHAVFSMGTNYGAYNNVTWGSDMRGGSSGGPVLKNFRVNYASSTPAPSDNVGNLLTSVVSWGYISTSPMVQGGSMLDATFHDFITSACSSYSFAC